MENRFIYFLFALIIPSFALAATIHADDQGSVSASVIKGIIIGIRMSFLLRLMPHRVNILHSGTHHHTPPLVCLQVVQSHFANSETTLRPDP
jgi:hypothetical protein